MESLTALNLSTIIENCEFLEISGNYHFILLSDIQNIKITNSYFAFNEAGSTYFFTKITNFNDFIETIIYSNGVSATIVLNGLIFFQNDVNSDGILIKNVQKAILKNLEFQENNKNLNFSGGCVGIYDTEYIFLFNINVVGSYSNMTTVGIKIIENYNDDVVEQETSKFQVN